MKIRTLKFDGDLLISGENTIGLYSTFENFLREKNTRKLQFCSHVFKGCKIAKLYNPYFDDYYYMAEGQKVEICDSRLEEMFGKIPNNIFYKIIPYVKTKWN